MTNAYPVTHIEKFSKINIYHTPVGVLQCNCYLVHKNNSNKSVILDPGQSSFDWIKSQAEQLELQPTAILLTHGHFDHVWQAKIVSDYYSIPVYINYADRKLLTNPAAGLADELASFLPDFQFKEPKILRDLTEYSQITLADIIFQVIKTPGHTPGSTIFLVENISPPICFTGDTLFNNGVGRTDLPGGNTAELGNSLKAICARLAPDTRLYPGHGLTTDLATELNTNLFLKNSIS